MGQAAGRANARRGAAVRRDAPLLLPKLFRGRSRRVSCIGVRNSSQNARPRAAQVGSFRAAAAKQRRRACRTDQRPQPACWLRNLCRGAQHAGLSHPKPHAAQVSPGGRRLYPRSRQVDKIRARRCGVLNFAVARLMSPKERARFIYCLARQRQMGKHR